MDVRVVRQQDSHGCMVACLAMTTGHTYKDVRAYFTAVGMAFDGSGGIHEHDAINYLTDHGFAIGRKYRWLGKNAQRPEWPAPAFAPVHILGVRGAGAHGVVLLDDGRTILDPAFDDARDLAAYEVAYMLGVFRVDPVGSVLSGNVER